MYIHVHMNQQEFNFASMVRLVNFTKINSLQNKPAVRYVRDHHFFMYGCHDDDAIVSLSDSQSSDYVKFQAVSTMKEALSREWPMLSIEEKATLKQHTLDYLMTKHRLINIINKYNSKQRRGGEHDAIT